jgi:hypothetical protein
MPRHVQHEGPAPARRRQRIPGDLPAGAAGALLVEHREDVVVGDDQDVHRPAGRPARGERPREQGDPGVPVP